MPSKEDQISMFYNQGDFGYVKEQREEMMYICEPTNQVTFYLDLFLIRL